MISCNENRRKRSWNEQRCRRWNRLVAVVESYMNHLFVAIDYFITWAINTSKIMYTGQTSIGSARNGIMVARREQSQIQVWPTVAPSKMYTITENYQLNYVDDSITQFENSKILEPVYTLRLIFKRAKSTKRDLSYSEQILQIIIFNLF